MSWCVPLGEILLAYDLPSRSHNSVPSVFTYHQDGMECCHIMKLLLCPFFQISGPVGTGTMPNRLVNWYPGSSIGGSIRIRLYKVSLDGNRYPLGQQ